MPKTVNIMANIVLTKSSGEEEIRSYFGAILELSKTDNEFPVNFDEVWMLVYKDKHKAIEELKDKFIQDVDFKAVTQKVECSNGVGSSRRVDYYLAIPCLEFFIARKVRRVFEVYRQVFHAVAKAVFKVPKTYSEALRLAADQQDEIDEQRQRIQILEGENKVITEERDRLLPMASYTRDILQSIDDITFEDCAKELGIRSGHALIKTLLARKVIFKRGDRYLPMADFSDKDYFTTRTHKYFHSDGSIGAKVYTTLTQKGRAYLHSLFNAKGGSPCLQ